MNWKILIIRYTYSCVHVENSSSILMFYIRVSHWPPNITDVGFHPDNILTQDERKHGNFNTVDSGTLHLENIYKIYFSSGYMTEISVELNQLTARS